jgi:hypothetical protein
MDIETAVLELGGLLGVGELLQRNVNRCITTGPRWRVDAALCTDGGRRDVLTNSQLLPGRLGGRWARQAARLGLVVSLF